MRSISSAKASTLCCSSSFSLLCLRINGLERGIRRKRKGDEKGLEDNVSNTRAQVKNKETQSIQAYHGNLKKGEKSPTSPTQRSAKAQSTSSLSLPRSPDQRQAQIRRRGQQRCSSCRRCCGAAMMLGCCGAGASAGSGRRHRSSILMELTGRNVHADKRHEAPREEDNQSSQLKA